MKAARQPRGLLHDVPGSIREHDRNKNFLNAHHYATCFRATNIALERASKLYGFIRRFWPGAFRKAARRENHLAGAVSFHCRSGKPPLSQRNADH